eukprot:CAMPEP_0178990106 /NCGR_PEP_ID=MMETSP0795-20121207/4744_1 /TAXON_ID=88552 /ORGANISM="Amoebophrya sp., Strain Ameob2" /LENGTH=184 /DNA_ID=CAMNT_0020681579 /DNA_START=119 /DNA_END=672 /DNA_ORIENTATION=-
MVCLCERCFEDSSDQNQQATQTAGCLGCNREHSPDTHLLIFASLCWCVGANYCVVGNWDGTGAPSAKLQLVFMALFYGVLLLTFLVSFCVWCGLEKTLKVVKDPTSSKYGVKEAAPCGVKVAGAPTEAAAAQQLQDAVVPLELGGDNMVRHVGGGYRSCDRLRLQLLGTAHALAEVGGGRPKTK